MSEKLHQSVTTVLIILNIAVLNCWLVVDAWVSIWERLDLLLRVAGEKKFISEMKTESIHLNSTTASPSKISHLEGAQK